jgi:O-antigen/teichoic acid export membrane protein
LTLTRSYALRVTLLTALSDWIPKAIGLLLMFLLGRVLGPGPFTTYTLALTWVNYAWTLTDQGLGGFGIRLVAARQEGFRSATDEIVGTYCVTAAAVWALVVAVAVFGTQPPLQGVLLAMSIFVLTYAVYPDWLLRGLGALRVLAIGNWATLLVWAGLLAATMAATSLDAAALPYAALAYGVSPVAGAILAWWWLRTRGWSLRLWVPPRVLLRRLGAALAFSAGGIIGGIATPLMFSTVVHLSSASAAASLALGLRLSTAAAGAGWIALQNMLPALVRVPVRATAGRQLIGAALPGIALTLAAAILWPILIQPFLGDGYRGGFPLFLVGVANSISFGMKYLAEMRLLAAFQDMSRTIVGSVGLVCTALGCGMGLLTGSPWYAALGFTAGEAVAALVGFGLLAIRGRSAGDVS